MVDDLVGKLFKVSDAYKNFIKSRNCYRRNLFPGVYRLVFASAFGGCGLNKDDINQEFKRIMMFDPNEMMIAGVNPITYPFILIGVHKSIIYGNMRYTDKLIAIAKKILNDFKIFHDEWLNFYENIYNKLYDIVKNKDESSYIQVVNSLSRSIVCNGKRNKYKCKVLAILGDLQKYNEIRNEKTSRGHKLSSAIDSDLRYISKKFGYNDKLEEYKNDPASLEGKIIPTLLLI
ncbi:MAG: hypothetical protein JHC26_11475 [Thermofilum sp.]|jgi:hypothetical protein|uniref:hypothetical protein n=1 Tax=Thermofilum sp. TaxID=1961369 RepID=UPI002585F593|nr:hypothetical protein [Thermofilum sp.]MCI4409702.1 hypothetical protein [Thermofilum sp.]